MKKQILKRYWIVGTCLSAILVFLNMTTVDVRPKPVTARRQPIETIQIVTPHPPYTNGTIAVPVKKTLH